jgi:hypothetical protein
VAKIPKVVAVYLPPEYVSPGGTRCNTCRDFIRSTSECMITVDPKVSGPMGTCTQYIFGKSHEYGKPLRLIPKSVVGYIEGPDVPTYCGRCRHYENPAQSFSTCAKVGDSEESKVAYWGCSNAYEARKPGD